MALSLTKATKMQNYKEEKKCNAIRIACSIPIICISSRANTRNPKKHNPLSSANKHIMHAMKKKKNYVLYFQTYVSDCPCVLHWPWHWHQVQRSYGYSSGRQQEVQIRLPSLVLACGWQGWPAITNQVIIKIIIIIIIISYFIINNNNWT